MRSIVIPENRVDEKDLIEGRRVVLFEPGAEYEAILRRGKVWPWVGDLIEGTTKEVPFNDEEQT
jgi:hypothetical protein